MTRRFDLAQANRLVPHLRAAFEDIERWSERIRVIGRSLEEGERPPPMRAALTAERDGLLGDIQRKLEELEALGVEVKSLDGLVDVRAVRNGREVFLCWKAGEAEFAHWHELDAGFAGRQPVRGSEEFEPAYLA